MSQVTLHIYDVGKDSKIGAANQYLSALGTGAFHGGVEVNDVEWSYGFNPDGTGVFCNKPKACSMHIFRESIDMGKTELSREEINDLVLKLKATWPGFEYDLLRHNCVIFSSFFCEKLGVGKAPAWVTNLAGAGATLMDGFDTTKKTVAPYAIIAAAKAGEIDAQYDVSGKAQAGAKVVLEAAGKFDEEYKVREKAFAAAAVAQVKAKQVADAGTAQAAALHKEADDDGDGQVSMDELKDFFQEKAGKTPDFLQAKAWELKEGATAMAGAIQKVADKDGDGQVSFAEATDYLKQQAVQFEASYDLKAKASATAAAIGEKSAQLASVAKAKHAEVMAKADKDGDGKVSVQEATEHVKTMAPQCECTSCTVQ